jgi:ssDNA-binding Zn-finger/Zn-ribbon topoisomerase 1
MKLRRTCPICGTRLILEELNDNVIFMSCVECNAVVDYFKYKELKELVICDLCKKELKSKSNVVVDLFDKGNEV